MSDEQQQNEHLDVSEPSEERKAELAAVYERQKGTDTPYKGVEIRRLGEVLWIMRQRRWSGKHDLPKGMQHANFAGADFDRAILRGLELQDANLRGADFFMADLSEVEFSYADLRDAEFGMTNLRGAELSSADLRGARLADVDLGESTLYGADLRGANLAHANVSGANLNHANVSGADLMQAIMNRRTSLWDITLDTHTKLGDIAWIDVPLLRVPWEQLVVRQSLRLGDEDEIDAPAREWKDGVKNFRPKTQVERRAAMRDAARAYRGLARELRDQNLSEFASAARLGEQRLQRRLSFAQRRPGPFLAGVGSWLLDLVSGYGELPARTFVAYIVVVLLFGALNFMVTNTVDVSSHVVKLHWDEALVLSLTSFHGRGFFPGYLQLDDWIARIGAVEAVIGLFIELILIATFSRRFLGE